MVGSNSAMVYPTTGILLAQSFCTYEWLSGKSNVDKWYELNKKFGWIRTGLALSYAIYGIYPDKKINTSTSLVYYGVAISF